MKNLIVLDDIKQYKRVYAGFGNSDTFDQYIEEAQLLDIKVWLDDSFLLSLATARASNALTQDQKNALYGCEYTYNGQTYFHEGIKVALAYYAYARFLNNGGLVLTPFGLVNKEDDYSRPAENAEVSRLKKEAIHAAEAFKLDVSLFLSRNADKYPLYNCISGKRNAARKSHITIAGQ